MIMKCTCIHLGQDSLHGRENRVWNECKGATMRCTVCKSTREISGRAMKERKNDAKSNGKKNR